MFRDSPPPELRYGVCVLEAAAPSECPAKVKLSIRRQSTRCLAWGSGYKKLTTFRFAGESDLDTRDPAACPLRLPDSGWHTSHGLDPVTHTCHSRPPVLTSSSGPYPANSTSSHNCWSLLSSSGVPCSACNTSRNLDPIHSDRSVCGYDPTTSQCPGPITCTSQVACLNLEPLLRAHSKAGEGSEIHVSITRRGGWKSTMYVPLEGFLQQLVRSVPAGKKFILRVRWEDKVIDVEAALSLSEEMKALREGEFCGHEMNVMATDAENWSDWEKDEEIQDQEDHGGGKNESDGGQETRRKEAVDKETEGVWEGNQGTRKEEAVMGEREDAEHTEKEVETDAKTNRKLEVDTRDEREWEGNIMISKRDIAMREMMNMEDIKEEFNIDITMKIKVNEPRKESKHRTRATPDEVNQEKERTARYQEPSPGEMTASTSFILCVYCLLLPLFVVSLILLLYVWARDVPL